HRAGETLPRSHKRWNAHSRCRRRALSFPAGRGGSLEQSARVARYHEFLVGGHDPGRDAARLGADARAAGVVRLRVELDAEPSRAAANARAGLGRVLADTSGEDDGVEALQRSGERTELAADAVDVEVDRQLRSWLTAREQRAHVARHA